MEQSPADHYRAADHLSIVPVQTLNDQSMMRVSNTACMPSNAIAARNAYVGDGINTYESIDTHRRVCKICCQILDRKRNHHRGVDNGHNFGS